MRKRLLLIALIGILSEIYADQNYYQDRYRYSHYARRMPLMDANNMPSNDTDGQDSQESTDSDEQQTSNPIKGKYQPASFNSQNVAQKSGNDTFDKKFTSDQPLNSQSSQSGSSQQTNIAITPQDFGSLESDKELNSKIRAHLRKKGNYDNVTLKTTTGSVAIEGIVDKVADAQTIIVEIQKVSGVKSVTNRLKIRT
jgi:osmotically-inducible protein OsmY